MRGRLGQRQEGAEAPEGGLALRQGVQGVGVEEQREPDPHPEAPDGFRLISGLETTWG